MRLRFVLLCTAALVAGTPAHAEPISAAIAAVAAAGSIGAAITTSAIGAFAINTAISVGLSLGLGALAQAMAPKPKAGEPLSGVETSIQVGGDVARQICIGLTAVRGQLVYHNTNGDSNQYLQQVFVLSDSLQAVYVNGTRCGLTLLSQSGPATTYAVQGHEDKLTVCFWDGTQTTADGTLIANANPSGKWNENSILTGMTYVSVYMGYFKDAKTFENGIPELMFEVKGARLYDWRQDSTSGGTGPHRWDDPGTWAWSDNPVVATYNYLRGFHRAGERLLGMGLPAYDIIHETFTAGANVCDETVTTNGPAERRYRLATILSADEGVTHGQTLETLLSTYAGYLYDYGGSYYCQAGAAQLPVKTLTDADLVVAQPVTFAAKRSRADLVNRLHGTFLDPSASWGSTSYTAQVSAGGQANDGEELGRQLDLMSVPSRTQAERIARIRLREARAQATAEITVGFQHRDLQAGDWITWASARFGTRTYRIANREPDPTTKALKLALAEINAAVFPWGAADEGPQPRLPVALQPGGRPSTVSGFAFEAVSLASADGVTEIPSLRFTWVPLTDPTVDTVVIEYRPVGSFTSTRVVDPSPEDGSHIVTSGVVGGTEYEARATITTTPARLVVFTPWVRTTTTDFAFIVRINMLAEELRREIESISKLGEGTIREAVKLLGDKVEQLAADSATEAGNSYERREVIKVAVENAFAAIAEETRLRVSDREALADLITVLTGRLNGPGGFGSATAIEQVRTRVTATEDGIEAVADRTTALEAKVEDPTTGLGASATAVDSLKVAVGLTGSGPTATASKITALRSDVDDNTADITAVQDTVDGMKVRFAVAGTINNQTGGFVFQGVIRNDGTVSYSMAFNVQSFVITDGQTNIVPFAVANGRVLIPNLLVTGTAQIADLVVGTSNLAYNASFTPYQSAGGNAGYFTGASWNNVNQLGVNCPAGSSMLLLINLRGFYRANGGTGQAQWRLVDGDGNVYLGPSASGFGFNLNSDAFQARLIVSPNTLMTLYLQVNANGSGGFDCFVSSSLIDALVFKR